MKPEILLKTNMALAHLECEGKDGCTSPASRGSFDWAHCYCSLKNEE